MGYNKNAGYGKAVTEALHGMRASGGKLFMVAKSAAAARDILQDLFDVDPDGVVRYHATIEGAVNATTASRGDVILVAPGHTESISNATDLVLDKAGVSVVGLGWGGLAPVITLDTANTASIPVSASDVHVENMTFLANFADIAAVFTVGAATDFTVKNCKFASNGTDLNFLAIVETNTTDNAADGLEVIDCQWVEPDTATTSMVNVDADLDGLVIEGCYVNLGVNTSDLPALVEVATGKDVTNVRIVDNEVIRLNDANPLLLTADTTTANTGIVARNLVFHADTASELLVTAGTNLGHFNNYATAVVDASGYLLPAADS